ncbi:MAG: hypothetical protein C5B44_04480 [Acidobacteria bacterium]|nr:MAG: hypothetical protein C5B44_04480 [Acidobacteriota bacterium]
MLRHLRLAPSPRQLQAFVDAFAHWFNHHRLHDALGGRTPPECLQTLRHGVPQSHIC